MLALTSTSSPLLEELFSAQWSRTLAVAGLEAEIKLKRKKQCDTLLSWRLKNTVYRVFKLICLFISLLLMEGDSGSGVR